MDAVISDTISEYETWVSILRDNVREDNTSFGDVVWVLVSRDAVYELWSSLSEAEKKAVAQIDAIVQGECRQVIANHLPSASSTPQARAEGCWWWFLNEA